MERKRQREIAMAAVAVAIIALAVYRVSTFRADTTAASTARPGAANQQPATSLNTPITAVELEALKNERPEPADSPRNPFRFTPKPAPAPPKPPVMPTPPPVTTTTDPAEPPRLPPIPLKFIGLLEGDRVGKVAILSDGRGTPFHGREGDIVGGRYRIMRIGVESVELAYLDGRGRQTIRQTGQ